MPSAAMTHLLVMIPAAVVVFATTKVDDLVVLTFFSGLPRRWQAAALAGWSPARRSESRF